MAEFPDLKLLLSQMNPAVGDIESNKQIILESIDYAKNNNYKLVIFPELALTGYPPRDNLLYRDFIQQIQVAVSLISQQTVGIAVILGTPWPIKENESNALYNAALVIQNGKIRDIVKKTLLPNYDVFDESRYFVPANEPTVIELYNIKIGLQICEDMWDHLWVHSTKVSQIQKDKGAELLINISASPYTKTKPKNRLDIAKNHAQMLGLPIIYTNLVGGQDELIFDGRSFALNDEGEMVFSCPAFESGNFEFNASILNNTMDLGSELELTYFSQNIEAEIISAIVLNLKDYIKKSGLPKKALVSLSGGIDSAITLYLAAKALGSENVRALYLPSIFSSNSSLKGAKSIAENLNIPLDEISIEDLRLLYSKNLAKLDYLSSQWEVADENIQARIRSTIMMFISNKTGALLLSTGNKSEIAVGYCTLYGDTAGGKNLIGDLYKTEIYNLAHYINTKVEIIPSSIINRAPSAELKNDQRDSDALPDYETLDFILSKLIEENMSSEDIIELGQPEIIVRHVSQMLMNNEFKRDQIVQTVKLSEKAFGKGWKMPIANRYYP